MHNNFDFFAPNTHCALVVALSEKGNYHSVCLKEMRNSSTSVFPNTQHWMDPTDGIKNESLKMLSVLNVTAVSRVTEV